MKKFHQPNSDQNFDFEERILILNNLSHNKKYIRNLKLTKNQILIYILLDC
jgi:hypothetical protein